MTTQAVQGPDLEGSLAELPMADLLGLLLTTGKSGVIALKGDAPGTIVVHEGRVALAESAGGPTLREALIGAGVVEADAYDAAELEAERGTPIVDTLVAAGTDEELLVRALREHTVGSLFELMWPSDDLFGFFAGETHPFGTSISFPPDELLAEADERTETWKVIAEAIPSTALVMRLVRSIDGADVTIDAEQWRVLSRVDGHASIADIIRSLGVSAFGVCAVLLDLLEAGLVEFADDET